MQSGGKRVVVLGGGVAGMSVAHELIERGFEVIVLESRDIPGGKARSIDATIQGLPGEHGFRFFPSFYQHLTDTLRNIRYRNNAQGVFDNLVNTTRTAAARFSRDMVELTAGFPTSPHDFRDVVDDLFGNPFGLTAGEKRFFAERLVQVATSCHERRLAEYEKIGWWQFIEADRFSDNYRAVFGSTTRSLVAADPRAASARTIGDITLQAVLGMTTPGKVYDRVLNGPTSQVWIDPWLDQLRARGVDYRLSHPVIAIDCDDQGIRGVRAQSPDGEVAVSGDWYVAAVPVEKMADLLTPDLEGLDPALARIRQLAPHTAWMNGIQFYLKRKAPIVHGHVLYVDAPWALTSISQSQFWPDVDFSRFGDGSIRDSLSVDISDWNAPGLNRKAARECTRDEIAREVWRQLRASLNTGGVLRLTDTMLHSWFLDPGIQFDPSTGITAGNLDPLLINGVDTWALRPTAQTRVSNLFLASDYVQTTTDLACMEGANEAARRAVNAILIAARSDQKPCGLWSMPEPDMLKEARERDLGRFRQGLPWAMA